MQKKKIAIIAAVSVAILVPVVLVLGKGRNKGKVIETEVLAAQTLVQKVTASGKLQAMRKADLSATVMGQIVNIAVKEGDRVKKGQFLMQIDRTRANAEAGQFRSGITIASADVVSQEANLEQARRDLARTEENYRKKIASEAEYQKLKTQVMSLEAGLNAARGRVSQARSQLDSANDSLNKTTLRAPMDGVITRKAVEEGEMAVIGTMNNPGTVLLTVSDMSVLEAELEASETDIPNVKIGQPVIITIDAFTGKQFQGVVTEVGASPWIKTDGSASSGTVFKVTVEVKNPPAEVRPGFTVTADIETGRSENTLAIPLQAIVEKPMEEIPGKNEKKSGGEMGGPAAKTDTVVRAESKVALDLGVFVVKNGKAEFVPVETGIHGDLYIEALKGPKSGDQVITGPFRLMRDLKNGDKVTLKKTAGGKKG